MLIRIIYEDDDMALIREKLKTLNMRELVILEDIVQREKSSRQQLIFNEWIGVLNEYVGECSDRK